MQFKSISLKSSNPLLSPLFLLTLVLRTLPSNLPSSSLPLFPPNVVPGPINRASIKPSADSRLRLSRMPWHNSPLQTNRRWLRWRRTSPQRHQNRIRRLFAVDAAVSSSFASNERRFWPSTTRIHLRGTKRFHYPLRTFGMLPDIPECFRGGPSFYEQGTTTGAPIKARDTNSLAAIRQHIARLLFMPHSKHSLGIRFATPRAPSSFPPSTPSNSPSAVTRFNILFSTSLAMEQ